MERQTVEQVGARARRLQRQLFLQLHHVMDEVCGGVPLDEQSVYAGVKMICSVLEVPVVHYFPGRYVKTAEMTDVEVAEGMPHECWKEIREVSAAKLQIWTEKFFPVSLRTYGKCEAVLEDVQEQVSVRDTKHILSPRLEVGGKSKSNR